ncbi:MAG: hypothetical protein ACI31A_06755 [Candidatus Limisoma sp.]
MPKQQKFGEEFDDNYSPTSWERDPDESDEDYEDRMQDQEDLMDYYND